MVAPLAPPVARSRQASRRRYSRGGVAVIRRRHRRL